MARRGYDGSIKIDTGIDDKGFNKGLDALSGALGGVSGKLLGTIGQVGKLGASIGVFASIGVAAIGAVTVSVKGLYNAFKSILTLFIDIGKQAIFAAGSVEQAAIVNEILAKNAGLANDAVREQIDLMKEYGIEALVAEQSASKFIQAQLDITKAADLARVAQNAAVIAQTNSSDAYDRLVHGVTTLNPLILRQLGIIVDTDQAYKSYAETQGLIASQLTYSQKQQAFLNATIEQGARLTGAYEASMTSATKQLGSMKRYVNTLLIAVGTPFQAAFLGGVQALSSFVKTLTIAVSEGGRLYPILVGIARIANVLIAVFSALARVFAAIFGGSGVSQTSQQMQSIADNAGAASEGTSDLADNIEAAGQAAKGALAPFDELNVLAQDTGGGGVGTAPEPVIPPIEIPGFGGDESEGIASKIQQLSDAIYKFLEPAIGPVNNLWAALTRLYNVISTALAPVFDELGLDGDTLLVTLRDLAIKGVIWLTNKLNDLSDWIEENPDLFGGLVKGGLILTGVLLLLGLIAGGIVLTAFVLLGGAVLAVAAATLLLGFAMALAAKYVENAWTRLTNAWESLPYVIELIKLAWAVAMVWIKTKVIDPIKEWFADAGAWIKEKFDEAILRIKLLWILAMVWLKTKIVDPIKEAFQTAWDKIKEGFVNAWAGMKNKAKSIINDIIGFINRMIRAFVSGINAVIGALNGISVSIPDWVPVFGGSSFGINLPLVTAPQIPKLATGAVIPPNSEFLAMLGDQRSGRNIEAPEDLIRQIVREEVGDQNINITFGGTMGALIRTLKPYIDKENQRIGDNLIIGRSA